jgi:hypothetical protein
VPATKLNRKTEMLTHGAETLLRTVSRERRVSDGARLLAHFAPPNPYQRSYLTFWNELVYTKDEARAGEVRKAPAWPLFRDLEDDLMRFPLQLWDKSRRVMASWFMCAFDVWLMAGGQDPRWPSLMRSTRNRQVILASRKLEDIQGSAWFVEERVKFIVEQLEERGIRKHWPTFPEFTWSFAKGVASNGGRIDAVPQGKDSIRGPGATVIHAEEVASWPQAQPSIESAKMVTQGGGHLVAITTAATDTYAADIVLDQIGDRRWR